MIRLPERPRSKKHLDFPLSVLVAGEQAQTAHRMVCPYLGCARRLRWAPVNQMEKGLVCKHHGVVWSSREEA